MIFAKRTNNQWLCLHNQILLEDGVETDISGMEIHPRIAVPGGDGDYLVTFSASYYEPIKRLTAGSIDTTKNIGNTERFTGDREVLKELFRRYPALKPKSNLKREIESNLPCPTVEETGFYFEPEQWVYLMRCIKKGKQIMLAGASGSGKTELPIYLLRTLKERELTSRNLHIFDMAVSNPEASFKGQIVLENGQTNFRLSRFAKEIQNPLSFVLLDESNRGDLETQNLLLPVLDGRRTLFMERAELPEIKVPEEVVFWATANIGYEFAGTKAFDQAFFQRFSVVEINFPPADFERIVLKKRTGIEDILAGKLVSYANTIRGNNAVKPISTRQLLETAELIVDGFEFKKAVELHIFGQYETNTIDGGERGILKSALQSL